MGIGGAGGFLRVEIQRQLFDRLAGPAFTTPPVATHRIDASMLMGSQRSPEPDYERKLGTARVDGK